MGALQSVGDETGVSTAFRAPAESGLRLVAVRNEEAIATLAERQCALTERIAIAVTQLQRSTHDPSVCAALNTVAARLSDVSDVRESLDDVIAALWLASTQPGARSSLVKYLEGVQRWVLAATDELSALATALLQMHADWSTVRFRLALAKAEWPTELVCDLEHDVVRLGDPDVATALEDMSFALHVLDANLAQRFG